MARTIRFAAACIPAGLYTNIPHDQQKKIIPKDDFRG
jgi:hypothetical protein